MEFIAHKSVFLTAILYYIVHVNADRFLDEKELHKKLFKDYNIDVRPPSAQGSIDPNDISIIIFFHGVKDYDDKRGRLTITCDLSFMWFDESLKWNVSEFNVDVIHVRKRNIWIPKLSLINSYYDIKPLGHDDDNEDLLIDSSGSVLYKHGTILYSICDADVTYFPFDIQTCKLMFQPVSYNQQELNYTIANRKINDAVDENGMWGVNEMTFKKFNFISHEEVTHLTFNIKIKRAPLYYILNIILPIHFICLLNSLVFLLPADSGERTSFAVTMLLAMALFLTIVADILPETSKPSILIFLLIGKFGMSGLILVCVMVSLHCRHNSTHVPIWLRRLIRCRFHNPTKVSSTIVSNKVCANNATSIQCADITQTDRHGEPSDEPDQHDASKENRNVGSPINWLDVSRKLDVAFTLLFLCLYGTISMAYIVVYSNVW